MLRKNKISDLSFLVFIKSKIPDFVKGWLQGYVKFNGFYYFYSRKIWVAPSLRQARILRSYVLNNHSRQQRFDFLADNFLAEGSVILDIGANIGYTTLYYSFNEKVASVISFEPLRQNLKCLNSNLNGNKKTYVIPFAISSKASVMTFDIPDYGIEWNHGNTGLVSSVGLGRETKYRQTSISLSLDDALNFFKNLSKPIGYIKIDVEGAELEVLKGGLNLISYFKPIVQVEFNRKTLAVNDAESIISLFVNHGYLVFVDKQELKLERFWEFYFIPVDNIISTSLDVLKENKIFKFKGFDA